MKILFDHQAFDQRYGGVSRYHYELIKGLIFEKQEVDISTIFSECEYLLSDDSIKIINLLRKKKFKGRYRINEILQSINQLYSIHKIRKGNYDIFHPTYYSPYFLKSLKKPFVVTVHDFVHEKFDGENYSEINNKKLMIQKADKIIAISENTKSDIISYYTVPIEKITVIYHGFKKLGNHSEIKNNYGNYILFVGKRVEYKNFFRFLLAASRIMHEDKTLRIVCTGFPFNKNELSYIDNLQISGRVVVVSANEQLLNSLYKYAHVFVYPSLYEGFGMPILEAFANNCPICISNTSCFPEIATKAALYFDPYDVNSIYDAMKNILYNTHLREDLIKAGQIRLLDFSWDKTVRETMSVYKSLL